MKQHKSHEANVTETLVFYDGPQLVLLKDDSNYIVFGMATEKEGMDYPLFCAAALKRHFTNYMSGKVDLRFVFKATPTSRLYFTELQGSAGKCALRKATAKELAQEDHFPEPGIFSSVHTHLLKDQHAGEDDRQKFLIDGTWEARDFSQFHGKMADTYSLLYVANRLDDSDVTSQELSFLRESIAERPWQGGGSYLSFYGGIKDRTVSMHPLRVAGIEYHSPGYVDLAGKREILDDIINSIDSLMNDYRSLIKTYQAIYRILKHDGLLGATKETGFSNQASEKLALKLAHKLAENLGLPNRESVLDACDRSAAMYSKLILSYFRRIKGLANFYIEGRVRTG